MYTYKTIIFDLDGTLYRTDKVFVAAFKDVCLARGVTPLAEEKVKELIGTPMKDICKRIFGDKTTDEEVEQIRREVRVKEQGFLISNGELYDGVIEMLDKLKDDGYILCLCSNGSKQYVDNILQVFGLYENFTITKSNTNGLSKSQLIKQILDESASCNAIVVGDRLIDFDAANDTGCLSIGSLYGYGEGECKKADFIAPTPMDIYYIIKKINGMYTQVVSQILSRKNNNQPFLVGINGVDTSGKTVFTQELGNFLKKLGFIVQLINLDDFHNPSHIRFKESDPVTTYLNNAFDFFRIEEELLKPIATDGNLHKELLLLDLQKDEYSISKRYEVNINTIVLFEGVLLYREPIGKYFDFRIYLDISFDEVLRRAIKRDGVLLGESVIEKYQQKYIPVQKWYIQKFAPFDKSDIVINNEDYNNPEIIRNVNNNHNTSTASKVKLKLADNNYLPEIIELHKDEEVCEMLGIVELPNENFLKNSNFCYSILDENDDFIGIVELYNLSWKNRRAELSIIIKSSVRGNGYGFEALNKILDIGFKELGLNRIWLRVLEYNRRAIELYKRVGFVQEGINRKESFRKGQYFSQIQMSILRSEWER